MQASEALAKVRLTCLDLPEVVEEAAWEGTRWTVAKKNFAHLVAIAAGKPAAYARAAATNGPCLVLTFRVAPADATHARFTRRPFFKPPWFATIVGLVVDPSTDWDAVAGLLIASYRLLAPKRLRVELDER